jgi:hypothetical protein
MNWQILDMQKPLWNQYFIHQIQKNLYPGETQFQFKTDKIFIYAINLINRVDEPKASSVFGAVLFPTKLYQSLVWQV